MPVLNIGSREPQTTIGNAIATVQERDTIGVQAGTYINDYVSVSKLDFGYFRSAQLLDMVGRS